MSMTPATTPPIGSPMMSMALRTARESLRSDPSPHAYHGRERRARPPGSRLISEAEKVLKRREAARLSAA
jgi:hypothetical protein